MFKFIVAVLIIFSSVIQANESEVLSVDRSVSRNIKLSFPNDRNITPKLSDFEINNYVLMSNEEGERWAVITITNLSSGNRMLEEQHLLALFANGDRRSPLEYKLRFAGNETQSFTVSFGESKFPILLIYSSNER